MRPAFLIPAYQAEKSLFDVVRGLRRVWEAAHGPSSCEVLVVDDGSSDRTSDAAERAGARLIRHAKNLGKGAALRSGLRALGESGFDAVVSVDADGQHPAEQALLVAESVAPRASLVLGVRNLVAAGAPRLNRFSNGFANGFLSFATGSKFLDTQCGLRRYPLPETLALGAGANGYAFETEVLLRARRQGLPIVEIPVQVLYPSDRISHFHAVRDPVRIVARVLYTLATAPRRS
jgi:glycosyltransferase involved in cell wall biosynthesis